MKSKLLIFGILILVVAGIVFTTERVQQPVHVYNQSISGVFTKSQIWGGEILITGDVFVLKDLTILPGTIVKFAVQDDQQKGYETPADGYNDRDPTRLISYGKTHSSVTVRGKLLEIRGFALNIRFINFKGDLLL